MTSRMRKGLLVATLHVAIVGSLGAKLLVDRATRPRVWARTAPVDPNLPIRGRYVRLQVEAAWPAGAPRRDGGLTFVPVILSEEAGGLVARPADGDARVFARLAERDGQPVAVVDPPLAYFIPEHVPDPSLRALGEELWVEVTLPRSGAPRPIRLGVKREGVLTPLDIR